MGLWCSLLLLCACCICCSVFADVGCVRRCRCSLCLFLCCVLLFAHVIVAVSCLWLVVFVVVVVQCVD